MKSSTKNQTKGEFCKVKGQIKEIAGNPFPYALVLVMLTKLAAIYKATCKMSYADCFGAALARMRNAEFVTGDPEFKSIEKEIKINWLK